MRKKIAIVMLFLVILVSITGMIFSTVFSSSEELFPKLGSKNYHFGSYHEDIEENWSTVKIDTSDAQLAMTYTLSRATRNPFTACFINKLDSVDSLADFQDYNVLKVHLKSNVGMRIPVMLTLDYREGEKKPNGKPFPMVTLMTTVDYEGEGEYEIPYEDLAIPDWWYRVHRLHVDEVDPDKIEKVRGVVIGSCPVLKEKLQDTITVKNISLINDQSDKIQKVFIVACVIVFTMLFVFFFSFARTVK